MSPRKRTPSPGSVNEMPGSDGAHLPNPETVEAIVEKGEMRTLGRSAEESLDARGCGCMPCGAVTAGPDPRAWVGRAPLQAARAYMPTQ